MLTPASSRPGKIRRVTTTAENQEEDQIRVDQEEQVPENPTIDPIASPPAQAKEESEEKREEPGRGGRGGTTTRSANKKKN